MKIISLDFCLELPFFYLITNDGLYKINENMPLTIFCFSEIIDGEKKSVFKLENKKAVGILVNDKFKFIVNNNKVTK